MTSPLPRCRDGASGSAALPSRRTRRATLGAAWLAAALLAAVAASAGEPVRLALDPAPSPDGRTVAFSWRGDVFVGTPDGQARRLTAHPAVDRQPRWSPDGRRLAFISNRHGNWDLFVMDADGGGLRRITHHSDDDTDAAWTPDGTRLVFGSRRHERFRQEAPLWSVAADGSEDPTPFTDFAAQDPALSPDGRWLAFVRGRVRVHRQGFEGPSAPDVWLLDLRRDRLVRATTSETADDSPSWLMIDGRSLLAYRSGSTGSENVHLLDPETLSDRPLTRHADLPVTRPRAAGRHVVYEHLDRLRRLDVTTGEDVVLAFEGPSDSPVDRTETLTLSRGASDLAFHGDAMAFVLRGEVIVARADDEPIDETASIVTRSSGRDREPAFLEAKGAKDEDDDQSAVVFSSDRSGRYDLWIARPRPDAPTAVGDGLAATLAWDVERLTSDARDDRAPRVAPDGSAIAFRRGRGDLVVRDVESGRERVVSPGWNLDDVRWSPDSRWIAFSRDDDEFNSDVFVIPAEGGEPINVSRHPDDDDLPRWSANGRALAFRATRQGNEPRVALAFLREADHRLSPPELRRTWKAAAEARAKEARRRADDGDDEKDEGDGKDEDAVDATVVIDEADLHERVRLLAVMSGGADLAPSPDGLTIAHGARDLEGDSDLWVVGWNGEDKKRLTSGGTSPRSLAWTADGKSLTFLDGSGRVRRVGASGGSADTLPFEARLRVDRLAERRQVFDEAWRLLEQNFYDPGFHGVDWTAVRERYRPLAEAAETHDEFHEVVHRMLGELDASHLGISGGSDSDADPQRTGELGLELEPARRGLRVVRVVTDGPATAADPSIEPGDVIVSVDDVDLTGGARLQPLLIDRVGDRVRISIRRDGRAMETVVRPISTGALRGLLYDEWVEERRARVERLSGGRIGYVHVEGMNTPSLERFEQELHSVASGRDALLVDVRNNGGGWTTDLMLAMLMVRPHAVTVPRGGGPGYPEDRRPLYAWTKPMAALANEYSYSNAEIFSHAIQTLDRGPLVGTQTAGAVISTGGQRLLDGSWLRLPFRGWYVAGSGLNMEGNGARPDIPVPMGPEDEREGRDPQLEAAVRVLLRDLESAAGG